MMLKEVLFVMFVVFYSAKCQTTESVEVVNQEYTRIINLQRHLLQLLDGHYLNAPNMNQELSNLRTFMSHPLFTHLNEILRVLHGWATNDEQADAWISRTQHFFRLLMLGYFVDSAATTSTHYMQNHPREQWGHDEMFILRDQIRELYSLCYTNFMIYFNIADQILWYELGTVFRLPISVIQLNKAPWFNLQLRHFSEMRFLDNPQTFRPEPLAPRENYVREMRLLVQAQNTVLKWCTEMINTRCATETLFPHVDGRLMRNLKSSAAFTFATTIGGTAHWDDCTTFQLVRIVNIILMHEFINFMRREYERHLCHPVHTSAKYSSDEVNRHVARALINNVELEQRYVELLAMLNIFLHQSALFSAAYGPLTRQSYHPAYADTLDAVRMGYACAGGFVPYLEDSMVSTTQRITTF